ncbi:MAG: type VI secretion system baseplate subunit TssF [Cytophagales bacterium]|nr:type VI secretion system baseplate subunit TssF [Rhizobacter sp.]
MRDLLPYYEAELSRLRGSAKHFAADYPKIAGRLMLGADVSEDPHVERLIQSFALLAARVHKRIDDDFPLVTESLLDVLYPHYLRPFPSCSIAQFDISGVAGQMSAPVVIERGTALNSRPVRGVPCKFRSAYDVSLAPIRLRSASYRNAVMAPEGTRLPQSATSAISLQLELLSAQVSWAALGDTLRVYLDGEASQISLLREVLCNRVMAVMVQTTAHGPWSGPYKKLPELVGFAADEALIDYDERSHPAYRLLTEYFAFPDKFNFIDLPLPRVASGGQGAEGAEDAAGPRIITLHFVLSGLRADSDQARALESVSARNFALGCTPVVNLFKQNADPIRVTHAATQYPVVVDARRAFGYEVYSIDKVFRVKQTPHGDSIDEFRPFFSLQHDDLLGEGDAPGEGPPGRYWHAHVDEAVAAVSPGYELELSIVDIDFDPAQPQTDTLSLHVTATNRDLPCLLSFGNAGGDLFIEGGSIAREIKLLRKPTASYRFERGRGSLWRLISHLSLNHLSLSGRGVEALKEMLRLYDLPRDATNRRQVDGIVSIEFAPATAWLAGEPFASFVRGTEVRLMVDEDSYVGTGLSLFAALLDRFFGLYVHINSFSQLTVISARTQQTLFQCLPRNGAAQLI